LEASRDVLNLAGRKIPDDHGDAADTPPLLTIGYIDQMILIST